MSDSPVFGFLNIDKPAHMTSHDIVARVRRTFDVKKVGHAGTLDPLATGVLVVCLGAATRLSEYIMQSTKRYRAQVRLGVTTDTYDADGQIQQHVDASHITRDDLEVALPSFIGDIAQVPPMYSAIKQGGRKLYERARAGEIAERPPRPVTIQRLVVEDWTPPDFTIDVVCGAGTYIRSLAHDLGAALGVGAHLTNLVRTASGAFTIEDAVSLQSLLSSGDTWRQHLIPPDAALKHLPTIELDSAETDHVLHGRSSVSTTAPEDTIAKAHDPQGSFVAILRAQGGIWKPHKVFFDHDK